MFGQFGASKNCYGTFESIWDLTEVSESLESWYTVLTNDLVNPTFKISLLPETVHTCVHS